MHNPRPSPAAFEQGVAAHDARFPLDAETLRKRYPRDPTKGGTILVACGSFNPITYAHLRMFELAEDAVAQSSTHVVVAKILSPVSSAYAKPGLAEARQRIAMCRAATENTDVCLDPREALRDKHTPTRRILDDVAQALREISEPGMDLNVRLLCGADWIGAFQRTDVWPREDVKYIAEVYRPIVITRPGYHPRRDHPEIMACIGDRLQLVDNWVVDGSNATAIRNAVANGRSVRYLTPDGVLALIREFGLYTRSARDDTNQQPTDHPSSVHERASISEDSHAHTFPLP